MPLICLPVNIRSYWIARRFNSVYFDGAICDNLIFDNKLVEEKNTRVKITFDGDRRDNLLSALHRENTDWKINVDIDPTSGTTALDRDGNKLTVFKLLNLIATCCLLASLSRLGVRASTCIFSVNHLSCRVTKPVKVLYIPKFCADSEYLIKK